MQKVDALAFVKQIGDEIIAERAAHAAELAALTTAQTAKLSEMQGALDAGNLAVQSRDKDIADLQAKLADALAIHDVISDQVPDDVGAELQKLVLVAKG